MRNVRFNLWQMLLVVALVLGMIAAVLAGIQTFIPSLQLPWILPLLALVTADAVITQRLVTRERLSLGEQGIVRTIEWTLLLVAIRVASLGGEDATLLQVIQPWLRDPLAFFGGTFSIYVWPALITWGVGVAIAQAVLSFETELPRPGVRSLPNEEAALLEDRALALAQFDRYWLCCTLVGLAGAALALYQTPLVATLQSRATAQPVVGVLACLLAGLTLHSQGQLDRLRYGWQIEQLDVAADVPRRWRRASALLIGSAFVIGLLLSQGTLWIPAPPLVPILNALLVAATFVVTLIIAFFGLLLFPIAWLLAYLAGSNLPPAPAFRPLVPPQVAQVPSERPLLPALIFWLCVILLVGVAVLRYIQQRQDLRVLLGRWRGTRWLMRMFGAIWHDLQDWSTLAVQTLQRRFRRSRRLPQPRVVPPGGTQAQLRQLYRRMIRSAEQRGIHHPRSQTPYEFRSALSSALPPVGTDVSGLTEIYVETEYGPQPAQSDDVRRARRHWRRIKQRIARSRAALDPLRVKGKRDR